MKLPRNTVTRVIDRYQAAQRRKLPSPLVGIGQ